MIPGDLPAKIQTRPVPCVLRWLHCDTIESRKISFCILHGECRALHLLPAIRYPIGIFSIQRIRGIHGENIDRILEQVMIIICKSKGSPFTSASLSICSLNILSGKRFFKNHSGISQQAGKIKFSFAMAYPPPSSWEAIRILLVKK